MDITAAADYSAPAATFMIDVTRPSFDHFYTDQAESITRALAVTLGDTELAADAMAEAMTRAWQRWPKISTYDKPAAWVYRVALNWAFSWRRRRRRERERPVVLGAEQVDHGELVVRDDSVDVAIETLSIEHRSVIVCRLYLDWSIETTAHALGIAPGTVKSRMARALAELRTHMEEER